jgi:hypothetical protein
MTSNKIQQIDNEIIANQLIELFNFLMEHPDYSKKDACDELGINYRAALRWINENRLSDYLSEIHDVRSDVAQITALDELNSIIKYQAKIARGEVSPSGASPTAAAAFVLEVAKLGARRDAPAFNARQINVFVPQMGQRKEGAPAVGAPHVRELKD